MSSTPDAGVGTGGELPLFPLRTVLFPDGLLALNVFEARYLDMVADCMRTQRPFGVVALKRGGEVRTTGEAVALHGTGTISELIDVDSAHPGTLQLRCRGTRRFSVRSSRQQADGLWIADIGELPADDDAAPAPEHADAVRNLRDVIAALAARGAEPFLAPHRFDSAGWVANRWAEILPLEIDERQALLELDDPLARLGAVVARLRPQAGAS